VAARLRHPNIVTVHDIISTASTSLIVMELVEGETLQSRLRARGRLDLPETVRLLGQVASALDHAHANQVVQPGREAGEHHDRAVGPGEGDGLRHRQAG